MTKQSQSARGRYVSAEKVQELFAQLGVCAQDVNVSVQHVATNPFPSMSMVGQ